LFVSNTNIINWFLSFQRSQNLDLKMKYFDFAGEQKTLLNMATKTDKKITKKKCKSKNKLTSISSLNCTPFFSFNFSCAHF